MVSEKADLIKRIHENKDPDLISTLFREIDPSLIKEHESFVPIYGFIPLKKDKETRGLIIALSESVSCSSRETTVDELKLLLKCDDIFYVLVPKNQFDREFNRLYPREINLMKNV